MAGQPSMCVGGQVCVAGQPSRCVGAQPIWVQSVAVVLCGPQPNWTVGAGQMKQRVAAVGSIGRGGQMKQRVLAVGLAGKPAAPGVKGLMHIGGLVNGGQLLSVGLMQSGGCVKGGDAPPAPGAAAMATGGQVDVFGQPAMWVQPWVPVGPIGQAQVCHPVWPIGQAQVCHPVWPIGQAQVCQPVGPMGHAQVCQPVGPIGQAQVCQPVGPIGGQAADAIGLNRPASWPTGFASAASPSADFSAGGGMGMLGVRFAEAFTQRWEPPSGESSIGFA